MKDLFGVDVVPGCYVLYARSTNHTCHLNVGRVIAITKSGNVQVQGAGKLWSDKFERLSKVSTLFAAPIAVFDPPEYLKEMLK